MKKNKYALMIKNLYSKYPTMFLFVIGNFVNAILLRLFTTGHFQVRSIFFDLGILVLLAAISLLVKKRRNLYYGIATFLLVFICTSNSLYYNYYISFVSASLLATSVFVKDVSDAVMDMVVRPCDLSYLWLFIAMGISFKKHKEESNKRYFVKGFFLAVVLIGIGCALPPYNSFSRLYKLWNRVAVLDSFGPYVYQADDIVQSLKPTFNNMFGYDKSLKEVKDYYENNRRMPSNNEYTDILAGKNVIAIHAESLQSFVFDLKFNGKEVAPNISKMLDNSIYFSNFYAQVGVGTSSDTEFTYATGLMPSNNGTVFVNYFNNKFVTVQNLLKDKGYYVFSMHGNVGDFWNRDTMHLNMGYDKLYSKSSFEIDEEYGLGLSDASFFRQAVPMIKKISEENDKPFYGTLITLTNHTPWRDAPKFSDYDVSINGNDYLSDTLMGKYLKSVNYMDKAIGKFIDDLDKEGLLDNTAIIIYGDHDARLGRKQFDYLYNYDVVNDTLISEDDPRYKEFNDYDYELSKNIPLIIWTKDMKEAVKVDTPMGMIDVSATVGNMLGIYNKYSLGNDVMSIKKEDAIVVFKDGSFITDKIYYNVKNASAYTITGGVINNDYIDKRCEYADKIIEVSDDIITYDLIKKLD